MTKKPYVLVVEDDEWMAGQHIRTLQAAGIQADFVQHALAAMDALDARRPDVLVLDVLLPGPNVFTLLHEIRSHGDLAGIPVILCTATADQLAGEDIATYGIRTVLDKTKMYPDDLVKAVKRVLL